MYLSRLTLDPRSPQARRDLADPYEMHRTLARAFAVDEGRPPRLLWRLEAGPQAWTHPTVLVQAPAAGDWSALAALPNYLGRPVETRELSPDALVVAGGRYRFRLLANPTVSREGKRFGLVGEEEQQQWLARQGGRHGFDVQSVLVTSADFLNSRKGEKVISVQRACFEGILQVQEQVRVVAALRDGIGPAKAFGCGLLSLARI